MVVIFSKGPSICYFNPFRLQEGVFPDGPTILCHTPLPSSTPSPFETPFKFLNSWDVWESLSAIMSDVGSVYNTCAKGMKSGKICSDFAFTVVKIYTIFFLRQ